MPLFQPRSLNLIQPPDKPTHQSAHTESSNSSSKLSETASLLKTLVVPALVSLAIFLLLSYVIVPAWRRYRNRYSQYLPLDTLSSHTNSLRNRIQDGLVSIILPSTWSATFRGRGINAVDGHENDTVFDDDDGEELFEVDENRREALSLDTHRHDDGRRLSRELEEGFKDDSDDETLDDRYGRSVSSVRN